MLAAYAEPGLSCLSIDINSEYLEPLEVKNTPKE